jgi:hypothetical protein
VIDGIDIVKRRREHIRWILLRALDNARPEGTNEAVLLMTIQGLYADATQLEIRRELDYLKDRRVVTVENQHTGHWHAELARYGVDIVEYTVPCEPGIARPQRV